MTETEVQPVSLSWKAPEPVEEEWPEPTFEDVDLSRVIPLRFRPPRRPEQRRELRTRLNSLKLPEAIREDGTHYTKQSAETRKANNRKHSKLAKASRKYNR